jgi:guanine nucleotide-binding protein G(i) subunit alpha
MVIDANVIQSMQTLIKYSDNLMVKFGTRISDDLLNSKNFMVELDEEAKLEEHIANHISMLWKDPGIRITFEHSNLFQLPESTEYFLNRVHEIARADYIASFEDTLRSKSRTSGFSTTKFIHGDYKIELVDSGVRETNERSGTNSHFPVQMLYYSLL